jgi:hypothetical protein
MTRTIWESSPRRRGIDGGGNAFDLYRTPALRLNDEKFAAALAAALALGNLAAAPFVPLQPYAH